MLLGIGDRPRAVFFAALNCFVAKKKLPSNIPRRVTAARECSVVTRLLSVIDLSICVRVCGSPPVCQGCNKLATVLFGGESLRCCLGYVRGKLDSGWGGVLFFYSDEPNGNPFNFRLGGQVGKAGPLRLISPPGHFGHVIPGSPLYNP